MRSLPLAIPLALALAPPAAASSAEVGPDGCFNTGGCRALVYRADPGEANDLTRLATGPYARDLTIRDAGAAIRPGPGCEPLDEHTVKCIGATYADVQTGDGNDRVTWDHGSFDLGEGDDRYEGSTIGYGARGGPGDDVLVGGSMYGTLDGGPGDDRVVGGAGGEDISGGSGRDVLEGGAGVDDFAATDGVAPGREEPVADAMNGGEGDDAVNYGVRRLPTRIDLSGATPSGVPGEGDRLSGIEAALGGFGDDAIVGDEGPNSLNGWYGDDEVHGGGGNDVLRGGLGFDRAFGQEGDDFLDSFWHGWDHGGGSTGRIPGPDRKLEPLDCGPGRDRVSAVMDIVEPGCESIFRPVAIGGRRARFVVPGCRKGRYVRGTRRCRGTLAIRAVDGPGFEATVRFRALRKGGTVSVPLPPPEAELEPGRGAVVLLEARFEETSARPVQRHRWVTRLPAAPFG